MKTMANGLITIVFLFNVNVVYSCSRPPGLPTVKEAYNDADNVYLVFAESITTTEQKWGEQKGFKQEVDFLVLERWKGNIKIGEKVKFISDLRPGSCAVSAVNDPPWLEVEPTENTGSNLARYARLSGIWLIYEHNNAIHQLEPSGRTAPLEHGGALDIQELYVLSGTLKR